LNSADYSADYPRPCGIGNGAGLGDPSEGFPVLVFGEARNIGAIVRAAANFQAESVRVVGIGSWWNGEAERQARVASAGAWELVGGVALHETLEEAAAECHVLAATSARGRSRAGAALSPETFFSSTPSAQLVGVVFGPESQGLSAQDLAHCHVWLRIPTSEPFPSLNLAQAVLLVLYEASRARQALSNARAEACGQLGGEPGSEPQSEAERPATAGEQEALLARWQAWLEQKGALPAVHPERMLAQARRLLQRAQPTPGDLALLDNVLKRVKRG
jgi:tRNA/rRNA methyltransferase